MPTTQPTPSEMEGILSQIENLFTAVGVMIALVGMWRWYAKSRMRRDPLIGSPIRRGRIPPMHAFTICFVTACTMHAAMAIARTALPAWPDEPRNAVIGLVAGFAMQVSLAALGLVSASFDFPKGLREFGLWRTPLARDLGWSVLLLFVCLALTRGVLALTLWILSVVSPGFEPPTHGVFQALDNPELGRWVMVLAYAGALIVAPVGEEVFFRGIVQSGMSRFGLVRPGSMLHRHVAVLFGAVLFGIMHMPHHIPALIVLGLILGYAYERTGSLRIPILIHILFNGKSLLWDALLHRL